MPMVENRPCVVMEDVVLPLFAEHLGIGGSIKHFAGIDGLHQAEMLEVKR